MVFELALPLALTFAIPSFVDVGALLVRRPPIGSHVLVSGRCSGFTIRSATSNAGTTIHFANHAMRCDDELMLLGARVADPTLDSLAAVDGTVPFVLSDAELVGSVVGE